MMSATFFEPFSIHLAARCEPKRETLEFRGIRNGSQAPFHLHHALSLEPWMRRSLSFAALCAKPWCEVSLQQESSTIGKELAAINRRGYLTINSQVKNRTRSNRH